LTPSQVRYQAAPQPAVLPESPAAVETLPQPALL